MRQKAEQDGRKQAQTAIEQMADKRPGTQAAQVQTLLPALKQVVQDLHHAASVVPHWERAPCTWRPPSRRG